jgi:hypothetical protein
MADQTNKISVDTSGLLDADEDALFEVLGSCVVAEEGNSAVQPYLPEIEALGGGDDLKTFGRSFWKRLNTDAYQLVCGSDASNDPERQQVIQAFAGGKEAVAAALGAALVVYLNLPAAIAAAAAAIAVRLFFRNAHGAMCEVWQGKLPQDPAS